MPEDLKGSWEEERGVIAERLDVLDKRLSKITSWLEKILWAVLSGVLATVIHAVATYLTMRGGKP